MKDHLRKYEPVVAEISTKYRAAMKEKMLTRLELEKTKNQLDCYTGEHVTHVWPIQVSITSLLML